MVILYYTIAIQKRIFIYLFNVVVETLSSCPASLSPIYGFEESSRSGPPVIYHRSQIAQNPKNIFKSVSIVL